MSRLRLEFLILLKLPISVSKCYKSNESEREWRGSTWRGIGIYDSNSLFTGTRLEESFLGPIVTSTCKTSEVEENRNFVGGLSCVGREVEI
jgi:hypothetical protein